MDVDGGGGGEAVERLVRPPSPPSSEAGLPPSVAPARPIRVLHACLVVSLGPCLLRTSSARARPPVRPVRNQPPTHNQILG